MGPYLLVPVMQYLWNLFAQRQDRLLFCEHGIIKVLPEHFWNIPSPDALPVT